MALGVEGVAAGIGETIGGGLENAGSITAEAVTAPITPAATLAADLGSLTPDAGIADLANIDIPEPEPIGTGLTPDLADPLATPEMIPIENAANPSEAAVPGVQEGVANTQADVGKDIKGQSLNDKDVEEMVTVGGDGAVKNESTNQENREEGTQGTEKGKDAQSAEAGKDTNGQSLDNKDLEEIVAAGGDGAVKNAEDSASQPASENQQNQTPDERQKRLEELAQKDKEGTITPEELQEFKDKRAQANDEQRLKELNGKDIKDLSDAEIDERNALREKASKIGNEESAEGEAEKRDKELEDLGTEMMQKIANGEELTPEEEQRMQELMAEKKMAEAGFTPEQARAAAKKAFELDKGRSERGSKKTQEAREKIQELMSLELQLISTRNLAFKLKEQRNVAIADAQNAHNDAESANASERMRKKGIEYSKYMLVANISGQIEGTRYTAQRIDARRKDLEQDVRRKLGVTGGLRALAEWAGAHINNTITEIAIIAEEQVPFGQGAGLGEYQRSQLAASGRM